MQDQNAQQPGADGDLATRGRREFLALCPIAWQTVLSGGEIYLVEVGDVRLSVERTLFYVTLRLYDSSSEMLTLELCTSPTMMMRQGRVQESAALALDAVARWLEQPVHMRSATLIIGAEEIV
jgi:hypothetical protein